jgi:type III secretion protein V
MGLAPRLRDSVAAIPGAQLTIIGGLIAIFAMLILPMPTLLLDLFIAINLTVSAMMVIAVISMRHPLELSTYPSLLLFTTFARAAITLATTRMILVEMDGGDIVREFGETAAGGSIIVGLVVFLIITVVQFMVISKGAERVAEVGARFSLDAMPGKQLSIDSDLRSGMLSRDEARAKRNLLEQESRLYGTLDGAMKFVKGESMASIVIVVLALIGGMAMGVLTHGLTLEEAASTVAILTIGEALVAQIPAIMSALAAGLLVTRGNDSEAKPDLAPAMFAEVGARPGTLIAAGAIAFVLGLVPGFPFAIFAALGLTLMAAGAWRNPASGAWLKAKLDRGAAAAEPAPEEIILKAQPAPRVEPLVLYVAAGDHSASGMEQLVLALETIKHEVQEQSGIALPALRLARFAGPRAIGSWELCAYDAPLGAAVEDPAQLDERLPLFVRELLRRNLPLFLGLQEVSELLDHLGDTYPEVVKETVRAVPVPTIVEVFRLLAEEQVSLRNLRDCVEAICDAGQTERSAAAILTKVRVGLRRNIIAPLCHDGVLNVMMIGPRAEEAIRATTTSVNGQTRLAIDPLRMRELVRLIRSEVEAGSARAILTAQELRRPLRLICAADLFDVPVLSFNELNPAVPLNVVGQLDIAPDLLAHSPTEQFATEAAE